MYDEYEVELVKKIDDGENLERWDLIDLLDYEIERDNGDNRRWSRTITSICELCGRYFCLEWEEGLTEMQENEFDNQPYEVDEHTYEKTITVTEWKRKE